MVEDRKKPTPSVPEVIPSNIDRPVTIQDIKNKLQEFYVMADPGVVEVSLAVFIANRLSTVPAPVWMLLVAESSGGKTEIIDMFNKLTSDEYKLAYHMSDMTPQTFISGMQNNQAESSLLQRINGMMVFFKDFTTVLQKNKEARREILSQFREIYDGEFNKDFGTGKSVHWHGRIGVMAGLTPPAMEMMSAFAGMGERFIAYYMDQPTDSELAKAMKNNYDKDIKKIKDELAELTARYIADHVLLAEDADLDIQKLPEEVLDDLNAVAQFATHARSQMRIDFRTNEPIGLPSKERFPRFVIQLFSLGKAFCLMNGKPEITLEQRGYLYKIALDSIPRTRRVLLRLMTQKKNITTSVAAARFGFTTQIMRGELAQLASLQIIRRIPGGGKGNEDAWQMVHKYREFMQKFDNIKITEEDMFEEDEVSPMDDVEMSEEEKAAFDADKVQAKEHAEIQQIMESNPGMLFPQAKEAYLEGKIRMGNDEDW